MAKIKTIARIKPCPEPYDDFECTPNKLYVRIPEHCSRDSSIYNKTRAPIVNHEFKFSHVLEASATQSQVFDVTAKDIITGFLGGYNGTIFAYGQTGSGKTHTMEGSGNGSMDTTDNSGILPRALSTIFSVLEARKDETEKVTLQVSYLEIYQEVGYDLLYTLDRSIPGVATLPKVTVVEGPNNGVIVRNLSMRTVNNEEDAQALAHQGQANRKVAETPMNQRSSRSHAIFTVYMSVRKGDVITKSKLHFVDLAGSERVCRTGVQGLQLAEAKYINLSLHHLEGVIIALHQDATAAQRGAGARTLTTASSFQVMGASSTKRPFTADTPAKHIPYRNSVLTMVLKDSLGGNCLTTMIATISVAEDNLSESISTCRFSQRVASILNAARKNEEIDDKSMIKRLRKRVAELEAENSALRFGGDITSDSNLAASEKGLTDEDKTVCAQIVQNFLQGRILDPVTAGISDPYKFRECMKVFKKLMMENASIGWGQPIGHHDSTTGRAAGATSRSIGSHHRDAPTGLTAYSRDARPRAQFRDDSNILLRNYNYLKADTDRPSTLASALPKGGSPSTFGHVPQPINAWTAKEKTTGAESDRHLAARGTHGGTTFVPNSTTLVRTPYEAKQVKEAMKLNKKVVENLAQQTKEQLQLKEFHSSVLEQELELTEDVLVRKTVTAREHIARQHAYILKLKQDGAESGLIEQEHLVESHLLSREAKMDGQLQTVQERLRVLRNANANATVITPTSTADSRSGHSLDEAGLSVDDKFRRYTRNDGKLNAKAVLDAMQSQDKLQRQIQDKIDRQRILVLSRQLEVKETATRQKLEDLRARLSQANASSGGLTSPRDAAAVSTSPPDGAAVATSPPHGAAVATSPRDGASVTTSPRVADKKTESSAATHPLPLSRDALNAIKKRDVTAKAFVESLANLHSNSRNNDAWHTLSQGIIADTPEYKKQPPKSSQQQHQTPTPATAAADSNSHLQQHRSTAGGSPFKQHHGEQLRLLSPFPGTLSRDHTHSKAVSTEPQQRTQLGDAVVMTSSNAKQSQEIGSADCSSYEASRYSLLTGKGSINSLPLDKPHGQPDKGGAIVELPDKIVSEGKRRQINEVVEKYRALRLTMMHTKEAATDAPISIGHHGKSEQRRDAAPAGSDRSKTSASERFTRQTVGQRYLSHLKPSSREDKVEDQNTNEGSQLGRSRTVKRGHSRTERRGHHGNAAQPQRIAVTMARYKKGAFVSTAQYLQSSPAPSGGSGNDRSSGDYLLKQMMAVATLETANAAMPAKTSEWLNQQQKQRPATSQESMKIKLRQFLSKEVMKKLISQSSASAKASRIAQ